MKIKDVQRKDESYKSHACSYTITLSFFMEATNIIFHTASGIFLGDVACMWAGKIKLKTKRRRMKRQQLFFPLIHFIFHYLLRAVFIFQGVKRCP